MVPYTNIPYTTSCVPAGLASVYNRAAMKLSYTTTSILNEVAGNPLYPNWGANKFPYTTPSIQTGVGGNPCILTEVAAIV